MRRPVTAAGLSLPPDGGAAAAISIEGAALVPTTAAPDRADCSMVSDELSSKSASSAGFRGEHGALLVARVARLEVGAKVGDISGNALRNQLLYAVRSARMAALAVRNTLSGASGNITVPMSRPSATRPGSAAKRQLQRRAALAAPRAGRHLRSQRAHVLAAQRHGDVDRRRARSRSAVEAQGQRARPRRASGALSSAGRRSRVMRRQRGGAGTARPSRAWCQPRRAPRRWPACPCPRRSGRRR